MSLFTDAEIESMSDPELDQGQLLANNWHRVG